MTMTTPGPTHMVHCICVSPKKWKVDLCEGSSDAQSADLGEPKVTADRLKRLLPSIFVEEVYVLRPYTPGLEKPPIENDRPDNEQRRRDHES